jgi:hypothetical protein
MRGQLREQSGFFSWMNSNFSVLMFWLVTNLVFLLFHTDTVYSSYFHAYVLACDQFRLPLISHQTQSIELLSEETVAGLGKEGRFQVNFLNRPGHTFYCKRSSIDWPH